VFKRQEASTRFSYIHQSGFSGRGNAGIDGFGVIEALPTERIPTIIFVTAYDQYAVRAFESYALDYLLKPFDQERFEKALERAKMHISTERSEALSQRILSALKKSRPDQSIWNDW
jgi:two-component system LytT family response regulator